MNKRLRQYIGLISAVVAYYLIHEGAHLIYAVITNTFRSINWVGVGIQIDVYAERMHATQLGVFCLLGAACTLICAYVLTLLTGRICQSASKVFRACMYYITIAMLVADPLYLSVLCGFFGGGDMNGISLLIPQIPARIIFGGILLANIVVFVKIIFPRYKKSFAD